MMAICNRSTNQVITIVKAYRNNSPLHWPREACERCFLNRTQGGRHKYIAVLIELLDRQNHSDLLTRLKRPDIN